MSLLYNKMKYDTSDPHGGLDKIDTCALRHGRKRVMGGVDGSSTTSGQTGLPHSNGESGLVTVGCVHPEILEDELLRHPIRPSHAAGEEMINEDIDHGLV